MSSGAAWRSRPCYLRHGSGTERARGVGSGLPCSPPPYPPFSLDPCRHGNRGGNRGAHAHRLSEGAHSTGVKHSHRSTGSRLRTGRTKDPSAPPSLSLGTTGGSFFPLTCLERRSPLFPTRPPSRPPARPPVADGPESLRPVRGAVIACARFLPRRGAGMGGRKMCLRGGGVPVWASRLVCAQISWRRRAWRVWAAHSPSRAVRRAVGTAAFASQKRGLVFFITKSIGRSGHFSPNDISVHVTVLE